MRCPYCQSTHLGFFDVYSCDSNADDKAGEVVCLECGNKAGRGRNIISKDEQKSEPNKRRTKNNEDAY